MAGYTESLLSAVSGSPMISITNNLYQDRTAQEKISHITRVTGECRKWSPGSGP